MRAGIVVNVTRADRRRLEAIVSDRCAPQKHVWRAQIILATADGCGTAEIMRRSGKAKPVVWTWQARFMTEGVDGLLRDKTRKPGKAPLPAETVQLVIDLVTAPPPGEATHWAGRMLAKAAGVSLRSVQRILEAHQLAPHRIRTFKLSNDPKFAAKLKDIVGLYINPPAHAVVLSVDEKSQIQALDRTQPGLPMKPGRAGTMTHDYKRNGTTTLFAALNVLDGTIISRNMKRHRHQELIRFLNDIDAHVPKRQAIHAIVDNYATPNTRKCANGSRSIRAGPSTSRQPRHHGSMPSKASSPSSQIGASNAACFDPSPTLKTPSTASSPRPMPTPNPSCGPHAQTASLPLSKEGRKS
jgi:transposase